MDFKSRLLLALFISIFAFSSCKKESQRSLITNSLKGSWELKTAFNGLNGESQDYPKGNGNILIFDGSNYEIYSSGKLVKTGIYQIIKEESILTKRLVYKLVYDNDFNSIKSVIDIEEDKLTYAIDAFDGLSSIYERR